MSVMGRPGPRFGFLKIFKASSTWTGFEGFVYEKFLGRVYSLGLNFSVITWVK